MGQVWNNTGKKQEQPTRIVPVPMLCSDVPPSNSTTQPNVDDPPLVTVSMSPCKFRSCLVRRGGDQRRRALHQGHGSKLGRRPRGPVVIFMILAFRNDDSVTVIEAIRWVTTCVCIRYGVESLIKLWFACPHTWYGTLSGPGPKSAATPDNSPLGHSQGPIT